MGLVTSILNRFRIHKIKLKRAEEVPKALLVDIVFSIPNMVCEGCAGKISNTLKELPGVQEVKPKAFQKHVYVQYEPAKVKEQQLQDALRASGFTAIEIR